LYIFLRGLFYVSYFTTLGILLVIIIMFIRIFYSGQSNVTDVGSLTSIFERYSCIQDESNYGNSYNTFISLDGLMFGIINIIGNFGTVFVDQSYWQLNATTSPKKSSIAFIIAGSIWFFIPWVFGSTMSIGYTFLNSFNTGSDILTSGQ
jgi:Na+/proline symporter